MAVINTGIVERTIIGKHDANFVHPLGDEEIANGDYKQSGIGNTISQSGGVLINENNQLKITSNGSSGFSRAVWNTNGLEGEQFLIKADIISVSGNTRFIDISNNQGQSLTQGTTFSTIITLGSAIKQVGFGGLSDTSFELVIDNVSVKEVLVNRESTVNNTGIVERSIVGVNDSDIPVWRDSESTSSVNNIGVVERGITGVNQSDPMFPDNTISNIVNIAGLVSSLIEDLKARATTFENEEATREILINLQKC